MISGAIHFLKDFYSKNLFERLVIYGFLSSVFVTLVFELFLGQWSYEQSQNKQWAFYVLLGLDYLVCYRKLLNIRVYMNSMSLFSIMFFMMVAHGALLGIFNHNPLFTYANDLIPPLMIGLNILRMQNAEESKKPIDFNFLIRACLLLAVVGCLAGGLAELLGTSSRPNVGSAQAYYPLVFAALFMMRPLPKWMIVAIVFTLLATIDDFNRTTLAFIGLINFAYLSIKVLRAPANAILLFFLAVFSISALWATIPQDSGTYKRIVGIAEIDLSRREGSVGERQAEWDAIQEKLKSKGRTVEWLGLGFGGTYEVQFTHEYLKNYGHAHYAWGWFNLRFGKSGYVYMIILMLALAGNGLHALRQRSPAGLFVAHMCFLGLIYCFTHVNSVFLLSGLHFFYLQPQTRRGAGGNQDLPSFTRKQELEYT